jgi:hypothetical protein
MMQKFFNETYRRIVAQGKAAGAVDDSHFICMYRAPDGSKCAAGQWISDEEYSPEFEGKSISSLFSTECENRLPSGHVLDVYRGLAHDCQSAHDYAARGQTLERHFADGTFLDIFRSNMEVVAQRRGLEMPA